MASGLLAEYLGRRLDLPQGTLGAVRGSWVVVDGVSGRELTRFLGHGFMELEFDLPAGPKVYRRCRIVEDVPGARAVLDFIRVDAA
jgi:hypothetical protein